MLRIIWLMLTGSWKQTEQSQSYGRTQLCRAEQIQKMNYWLLHSYSISSVCLPPVRFANPEANNILWHFFIILHLPVFRPVAFLDTNRWSSETVTLRRASPYQKSVSKVGTFDCDTLLNCVIFNIYALLRVNIVILPVVEGSTDTLWLQILTEITELIINLSFMKQKCVAEKELWCKANCLTCYARADWSDHIKTWMFPILLIFMFDFLKVRLVKLWGLSQPRWFLVETTPRLAVTAMIYIIRNARWRVLFSAKLLGGCV